MKTLRILALNSGSSSLKFAVHEMTADRPERVLAGGIEGIGTSHARLCISSGAGREEQPVPAADHGEALSHLPSLLSRTVSLKPDAIGHRMVQGGTLHAPVMANARVIAQLRQAIPLDPLHLPAALQVLEAAQAWAPEVPQVICFDTAFHHDLPRAARLLPLPAGLTQGGALRRYGFHGLSYEHIMSVLAERNAGKGRVLIAHLGSGASMAAVRDGKCLDTTMGLTPLGGLVMSSRPGDLDPGVLSHLLREGKVEAASLDQFLYHDCGLKGISGLSGDLRDLEAAAPSHPAARDAIAVFQLQAVKSAGALVAAMGGLDTLVFTGGIGEHSASTRAAICAALAFLGVEACPEANNRHADLISSPSSRITVHVIPADEELAIARHAFRLLTTPSPFTL